MAQILFLERERAVRELRAAVDPEEADRILRNVARIMDRVKREPEFLAWILGAMERKSTE